MEENRGFKHVTIILLLQLAFNISIYMDIPVFRQILGFAYLTVLPGILFLKFFKFKELNLTEITIFSVGLSIAFLMFFGLLINELLPLIGLSKPLSTGVLIVGLNFVVLLLCIIHLFKDEPEKIGVEHQFSKSELFATVVFICVPILSVFATECMNIYKDNSLLLLLFGVTAILAFFAVFSNKKLNLDIFSVAILALYASVLFATWLTTNYIVGYDSHLELYSFKITNNASLWNPVNVYSEIDKGTAMLSVTILPTIYSKIMNVDPTWVFKIVYPLLAAFAPLILYQFHSMHAKKEAAFLGAFLFITHSIEGLGSLKEWIATIFYILLFFVIFNNKLSSSQKRILFIIFSGALVVSHYSKSYIFLFTLILLWVVSSILKKNVKVTLSMVLIFATMAFAWYVFTVQATTFEALLDTFNHIYRNLSNEFFNPESRGPTVMTALGLVSPPSYLHLISRFFFYLTVLLILIGFISMVVKFRGSTSNYEYFILVCINMGILAMTVILPNLAESYRMTRFYRTALVILAPLCFFGAEEVLANLHKIRIAPLQKKISATVLTLIVLIPFFLFQSGFFYEAAKVECWSISLSRYRMPPEEISGSIIYETEVYGAVWLSKYTPNACPVYSDIISKDRALTSYGLINYNRFHVLTNATINLETDSVIYLRQLNTVYEIMLSGRPARWNITDLKLFFDSQIIYSNGDCIIYKTISTSGVDIK